MTQDTPAVLGYINPRQANVTDASAYVFIPQDGAPLGIADFGGMTMHVYSPAGARQIAAAFTDLAAQLEIAIAEAGK